LFKLTKTNKSSLLAISILFSINNISYAQSYKNSKEYFTEVENKISVLNKNSLTTLEELNLAELYKNIGKDEKAEEICKKVLAKENNNTFALYLMGELYKRKYVLNEAISYLKKIPSTAPEYKKAVVKLMELYVLTRDEVQADILIKDVMFLNDEETLNLVLGIFNYSPLKTDVATAELNFTEVLKINPKEINTLYYLASIKLEQNNRKDSRDFFNKAIESDFSYSQAHSLLGFLEFIDGQFSTSFEATKASLETNPLNLRGLLNFGNGLTTFTYKELEKDNPELQVKDEFFEISKKAVNLINKQQIQEAQKLLETLKNKYPKNIHTYIHLGSFYLNTQNYPEAIKYFREALKINPYYGLANCDLANAIRFFVRTQEARPKKFNLDLYDYSKIDMNSLKKVFVNYEDLTEKDQKVVLYSIYPLKKFLPILAKKASTHYIIPFYEKSTDFQEGQLYRDTKSFDGRLWDDIRGRGGFNSVTGLEDLKSSTNFDFNTLTHEFTHQVHAYALEEDL
jgi:tetratricopeptide (TPR) repeat protein